MIGYSFEYQGTLGDVGTGRWQRSDQSVSSTTSSEKTIGRTRTVEGGVEQSANRRRKSRAAMDVGSNMLLTSWLNEVSRIGCSTAVGDSFALTSSNPEVEYSRILL